METEQRDRLRRIVEVELQRCESYHAIARRLNDYEIKTPKGKSWTSSSVSRMAHREGLSVHSRRERY